MDQQIMEEETQVHFDELNLQQVVARGSLDFDAWTSLISNVEKTYPDDIEKISLVYEPFLSEFPLCYGYWRKFANHKAHLCTVDEAIKVFEQAVQSATYSVDVWVDYCCFGVLAFDDPLDIRRLFKRGLSFIGKDYLCHSLWDKYIDFEYSQRHWSFLAHIYLQTLKFPTKNLHQYYDRFKKLAAIWEEEIVCQRNSSAEVQPETVVDCEITTCLKEDEILVIIKDLLGSSDVLTRSRALQKYVSIGEQLYQGACHLYEKVHGFEMHIWRPYFHVKPLDACQLENWHHYLDFVEMHGDFDWAVKVYERCLIACANYPEFWMRYVEFMEHKGGREIANFALDRATKIFLKRLPAIHHFNAGYKEQIGDTLSARDALLKSDMDADSIFVENAVKQANMEKRLGNFIAAAKIYIEALERASKKHMLHALPIIYVNFSRLKYMITGSSEAGRDILIDGITQVPGSKLLLKELINFVMLHGGSKHLSVVDSVIYNAISQEPDESQGFSSRDQEDISNLYLELMDFCGDIHDIRKAWIRHRKLFPCSLRTTSASIQPTSYRKPTQKTTEGRQDIPPSVPQYFLGSSISVHLGQIPLTIQKHSLPENHMIHSDQVSIDQIQLRRDDASNSSTVGIQLKVVCNTESTTALREYPETNMVQEDHDHRVEQDLKPISLENLSLNTQENESHGLVPTTAHDIDVSPYISSSAEAQCADSVHVLHGGMIEAQCADSTQVGTQSVDSPQMINRSVLNGGEDANNNSSVSSPKVTHAVDSATNLVELRGPSCASNGNSTLSQSLPMSRIPSKSGESWLKTNNLNNQDFDSGICRKSQDAQFQQANDSPQQQYQKTEFVNQASAVQSMTQQSIQIQHDVRTQCQSDTVISEGNLSTMHAWPVQTLQQQGVASPLQSQLPSQSVSYPSEQMSQYPMQSHDQSGSMQNNQEYYQMWQYYYHQQQQQQIYLQQYYQLQQPSHLQLQQLYQQQQYQQQQLQMQQQYLQQQPPPYQQHSQFPQQQQYQQLQPQQQQQPPPLPYQAQQIPQHGVYMQQLQNQQYPQLQQQQLPDPQLLQQLLQQQQWKQQQLENHQKQQEQEQNQNLQQVQTLTPPEGTPPGKVGSPHPHGQSPQTQ